MFEVVCLRADAPGSAASPQYVLSVDWCANDPIALAGSALPRDARARVPVLGTRIVPL